MEDLFAKLLKNKKGKSFCFLQGLVLLVLDLDGLLSSFVRSVKTYK